MHSAVELLIVVKRFKLAISEAEKSLKWYCIGYYFRGLVEEFQGKKIGGNQFGA